MSFCEGSVSIHYEAHMFGNGAGLEDQEKYLAHSRHNYWIEKLVEEPTPAVDEAAGVHSGKKMVIVKVKMRQVRISRAIVIPDNNDLKINLKWI